MCNFGIRISVLILISGILTPLSGQEPENVSDIQLQSDIEEIMRSLNRPEDLSEMLDYFSSLQRHPVNINTADRETLERLLFLNDFQINSLLDYRRETGPLYSIGELQLVYGFDREVIRRIRPYITLEKETPSGADNAFSAGHITQEGVMRGKTNLESEAGYLPVPDTVLKAHPGGYYRGDRTGLYFRYQIRYGRKFSAGVTGEKDPGEPFFTDGNKKGLDYYSLYVQYQGRGILRQVNAGRYALRLGQGLVIWNGFRMSKSSQATDIDKRSPEVRYASSATEAGYLNGVSAVLRIKNFTVIPFFSFNRWDAHLVHTGDTAGPSVFSSFLTSGLHRTMGEMENKHQVGEWLSGMRITYRNQRLKMGLTSLYTCLNHPLIPASRPDNEFAFRGKENMNMGMDYTLMIKRVTLFGEAAVSKNGAPALLQGVQWYFSPLISVSLLGRYYRQDYHAFYANAFSETGLTRNESGLYMGFAGHFIPHVVLSGYVDMYCFPWLRYFADGPSGGREIRLVLSWVPAENFHADMQYKNESRTTNDPDSDTPMHRLAQQTYDHLRLQLRYMLLPQLQATSRLDLTRFFAAPGQDPEKGFMAYQQLRYAPDRVPVRVYGRFGMFDTHFSTRIYTYENDLLYSFSTPSFTGRGLRWYVMIKYPLFSHGALTLRVARTAYADRHSIGDGPARISEPHKTEIKAQVRVRF
ncbi:MAG: helix-hairpin-helix domain-containing protein [Bacteroidales bacterium]|nr:helix-hairpin-helix domain-containing protein [Bacteroidales bacterium]